MSGIRGLTDPTSDELMIVSKHRLDAALFCDFGFFQRRTSGTDNRSGPRRIKNLDEWSL